VTTGGNFDYTDDSVVAKISVDVPSSAVADIMEIKQATSGLRVELEAAARAQGSWADYLREIPQLAEQAAQAQRSLITALERTSYLQGQVGPQRGAPGQPGPAGQYSTAAPAGYINPFTGQPGQGNIGQAQAYMQNMAQQDPRLFANMQAQRGNAVNPAQLGLIGGTAVGGTGGVGGMGGGQGQGAAAPASSSPQASGSNRDSSAPPDPTQSGAPTTSEPQNAPADPHPDAPAWQSSAGSVRNGAAQVLNEVRAGQGSRAGMMSLAMKGMSAAGNWASNNPDKLAKLGAMGKGLGGLAGIAKGAGIAGLGVAGVMGINDMIQKWGATAQEYSNLGNQRGGGFAEGVDLESQAAMLSLNPSISDKDARRIVQAGLNSGLTGNALGDFNRRAEVQLKDQNLDPDLFAEMNKQVTEAGVTIKNFNAELSDMREFAKTGFTTNPERQQQMAQTSANLVALGGHGDALANATRDFTEGFADDPILGRNGAGNRIANQAVGSPMFQTMMGSATGNMGHLPDATIMRLSDQGNIEGGTDAAFQQLVKYAEGTAGDVYDKAAVFKMLLGQMGVNVSPQEALALYKKYTGGGSIAGDGKKRKAAVDAGRKSDGGSGVADFFTGGGQDFRDAIFKNALHPEQWREGLTEIGAFITNDKDNTYTARQNNKIQQQMTNDTNSLYAPQGRPPAPPSASPSGQHVTTQGSVQGNVTITVDQQGKVSAPQSIQLTGQQKSAYMGYGSAQLNDPSPGDPTYYHAYNGWGGSEG
jgi:hypothetical protein